MKAWQLLCRSAGMRGMALGSHRLSYLFCYAHGMTLRYILAYGGVFERYVANDMLTSRIVGAQYSWLTVNESARAA